MKKDIAKKKYEKPSIMMYKIEHRTQLLQNSMPTGPDWPGGEPW